MPEQVIRYFTVALVTVSHFCPAVLIAKKTKRWLPAARAMLVFTVEVLLVYFFTPSTQTSTRASVPVTLPVAWTLTGEETVEPLAGLQT